MQLKYSTIIITHAHSSQQNLFYSSGIFLHSIQSYFFRSNLSESSLYVADFESENPAWPDSIFENKCSDENLQQQSVTYWFFSFCAMKKKPMN